MAQQNSIKVNDNSFKFKLAEHDKMKM